MLLGNVDYDANISGKESYLETYMEVKYRLFQQDNVLDWQEDPYHQMDE